MWSIDFCTQALTNPDLNLSSSGKGRGCCVENSQMVEAGGVPIGTRPDVGQSWLDGWLACGQTIQAIPVAVICGLHMHMRIPCASADEDELHMWVSKSWSPRSGLEVCTSVRPGLFGGLRHDQLSTAQCCSTIIDIITETYRVAETLLCRELTWELPGNAIDR